MGMRSAEETINRRSQILKLVIQSGENGIKESTIAAATGIHKRTVNNHLRHLKEKGIVNKKSFYWTATGMPYII